MSAPPYMPLYVADYLGDTRHLSTEQHGAYLLLLMAMWRAGGSLPADPAKLARITGMTAARWARISDDVLEFFDADDGAITHGRVRKEIEKYSRTSDARKESGARGGRAKALKTHEADLASATDLPEQKPAISEPEPEPEEVVGDGARDAVPTDWPPKNPASVVVASVNSGMLDPNRSAGLVTTAGRLAAWKAAGASFDDDVLPVVTALVAKQRQPISSWTFFDNAIARSIAERARGLDPAQPLPRKPHDRPSPDDRREARNRAWADIADQERSQGTRLPAPAG